MADKHTLTLDILREYRTDLSVPREVEFNIVSLIPIAEAIVQEFATRREWSAEVERVDDLFMATLKTRLVISEESIHPLSEAVERFAQENGWDYDGWGAFTYK
jgi:Regulator of ribonuclease activity B